MGSQWSNLPIPMNTTSDRSVHLENGTLVVRAGAGIYWKNDNGTNATRKHLVNRLLGSSRAFRQSPRRLSPSPNILPLRNCCQPTHIPNPDLSDYAIDDRLKGMGP